MGYVWFVQYGWEDLPFEWIMPRIQPIPGMKQYTDTIYQYYVNQNFLNNILPLIDFTDNI